MRSTKTSFAATRQKVSIAKKIIGGMVLLRFASRLNKQNAWLGDNYPVLSKV